MSFVEAVHLQMTDHQLQTRIEWQKMEVDHLRTGFVVDVIAVAVIAVPVVVVAEKLAMNRWVC